MKKKILSFLTFVFFTLLISSVEIGLVVFNEPNEPVKKVKEDIAKIGVAYPAGTGSMLPLIQPYNRLVYSLDNRSFETEDVIIFTSCDGDAIVHRINLTLQIYGKIYYVTKGDANKIIDNCLITNEMIVGKVIRIEDTR